MTEDQLAAIRARSERGIDYGDGPDDANADRATLLAEVDRLRDENATLRARQFYDGGLPTIKVMDAVGQGPAIYFGDGPEAWSLLPANGHELIRSRDVVRLGDGLYALRGPRPYPGSLCELATLYRPEGCPPQRSEG